ncbi:MAG: hypothetical protein QOD85_1887 [Gaiellaceae bacterium]|nr:hypothetical protein [Gaiellaceae bacterium]
MAATWPAVLHARTDFLSGGAPAHGEASPGDHLQTLYHYWLVGHQLEHGRAPWRDPYTFRPEAKPQPNYPGWPFGIVFWPLGAVFGLVGGWNALQLLGYCLAGFAACAWLRELGLPRGPALAGGLAFAIAPYRVEQSVGHLLGPISMLLPLSLWAFERARKGSLWWLALAGAALASIPLSGQVHLALGAIPFFVGYALCRTRDRRLWLGAAAGALAAVGAGLVVRQTVIARSTQSGGRSLNEITFYSARVGDFFSRHVDHARSEQFVFLGWVTPLVALAGLVLLLRTRRFGLAAILGAGALVPLVLALGTRTPVYSALWHALPPFRFPRVPERLLPIASLCIAALFAYAVAQTRRAIIAPLAIALLLFDLHAHVYGKSKPGDPAGATPSAVGRLLELPVFDPGVHYGSVYLWYDTAALRERPSGYSTTAPRQAKVLADRLQRLNCGDWSGDMAGELDRLGVESIALHRGLYVHNPAVPSTGWFAARGLFEHDWSVQRTAGPVWLFARGGVGIAPKRIEPDRARPVFCQGWFASTASGRYMSETHAPFWIYGSGTVKLDLAPSALTPRITVDGRPNLKLRAAGWHLVTVDVPSLITVAGQKRKVGVKLLKVATSP